LNRPGTKSIRKGTAATALAAEASVPATISTDLARFLVDIGGLKLGAERKFAAFD